MGLWTGLRSTLVAEMLSTVSGFDWFVIDMEHSPNELDALDALFGDADVEEERRHAFKRARRMAMRAGDVLFMSAEVLHCSGPNGSGRFRRAWMPQFSLAAPAGGGDGAV